VYIRIDGVTYDHDVVIDRGEVHKRKKESSKKFRDAFVGSRFVNGAIRATTTQPFFACVSANPSNKAGDRLSGKEQ